MRRGGATKQTADQHSGPYRVLECGNKAWKVQVGEIVESLSRDCLKPHLGSVDPEAVQKLRCGRLMMSSVVHMASSSLAVMSGGLCV